MIGEYSQTDYKHFAIGADTNTLYFIHKFRHNAMADARKFKCANVLKELRYDKV